MLQIASGETDAVNSINIDQLDLVMEGHREPARGRESAMKDAIRTWILEKQL